MAQGWTQDQDNTIMHMLVSGHHVTDIAKALGKSRSTIYKRSQDLKEGGWNGHTDPLAGQQTNLPPPKLPKPRRPIWGIIGRHMLDSTFKPGGFMNKVISRRVWGDDLKGGGKSGVFGSGGAQIIDALNTHHRIMMVNLTRLDSQVSRGSTAVGRGIANMSDRLTSIMDRISTNLDRQSYDTQSPSAQMQGPIQQSNVTQSPAQASMLSKIGGIFKGRAGTIAKVAGGAALLGGGALAANMLFSNKAHASTNPNDMLTDKPDPNRAPGSDADPVESKLRKEAQDYKDTIKNEIPELTIKGQDLTFKGQIITFEADEFDISALLGKGKGKGSVEDQGFQDGVPPPDPKGVNPDGTPQNGSQTDQQAPSGSDNGSPQAQGGILDKIKSMFGGGTDHPHPGRDGPKGGGVPEGGPKGSPPATQPYDNSKGFTAMPEGQSFAPSQGAGSDQNSPTGSPANPAASDGGGGGSGPQSPASGSDGSSGGFWSNLKKSFSAPLDQYGNPTMPDDQQQQGASPATGSAGKFTTKGGPLPQLGLDTSKFTPNDKNIEGATNPRLADQRSGFFEHMDQNPATKDMVIKAALAEGGRKGLQNNIEQMSNYGNARNMKNFDQVVNSGFFGPVNRGEAQGRRVSKEEYAAAEKALDAVRKGSNNIDYRTDQGMPGDPNYAREANDPRYRAKNINGNFFADHPMFDGKNGSWASRQKQADSDYAAKADAQKNQVAGPGGPSKPPIDIMKTSPVTPDNAIPGGLSSRSISSQNMMQNAGTITMKNADTGRVLNSGSVFKEGTTPVQNQSGISWDSEQGGLAPTDKTNTLEPVDTPPANDDFLSKSENNQADQMNLNKPVINDQGAVGNDGSSGRSPQDVRSDLQDVDGTEMQTAMDDHFNGGDFPGLGDQDNSDTDTGFG